MTKKILAFIATAMLSLSAAYAQNTTVVATRVVNNIGTPVTGQLCFGATCLTVTAGAVPPGSTVPNPTTGALVVKSGSTTILTVPTFTVSGSVFNYDTFVVPSGASITGVGMPRLACYPGAHYTQTDGGMTAWTCVGTIGQGVWSNGSGPNTGPSTFPASGQGLVANVNTLYSRLAIPGVDYQLPATIGTGAPVSTCPSASVPVGSQYLNTATTPFVLYACASTGWGTAGSAGGTGVTFPTSGAIVKSAGLSSNPVAANQADIAALLGPASVGTAGAAKCDGTSTICDGDGTIHASGTLPQLTSDVTTPSAGSAVTTVKKINGTSVPAGSAIDQALITSATNTANWSSLPSCSGASNALTYNTTTHAYACNSITATLPQLTGDTTTPSAGSAATTVVKINGTTVPSLPSADQALITSATSTANWSSLPSCSGAANALTYNTSTHAYACNTITASATPGGTTGAIQYNNAGAIGGTNLSGLVKGNGSTAPTAAVPGTDYVIPSGTVNTANNLPSGLTGIVKVTAGVPAAAVAGDFPTLNQNTTGTAGTITGTITGSQVSSAVANATAAQTAVNLATPVTGLITGNGASAPSAASQTDVSGLGYNTDTGTANAYAVTLSKPAPLAVGLQVRTKIVNANTGASTLTVNTGTSGAAQSEPICIKSGGNLNAAVAGDLAATIIHTFEFNGSCYQTSSDKTSTGPTYVTGETLSGTPNGTLTTFGLAHTPLAGSLQVLNNGLVLSSSTYSVSGTTVTISSGTPQTGDVLTANYTY